jgi:hypothetical protein
VGTLCSSETSINFYRTIRSHIQEYGNIYIVTEGFVIFLSPLRQIPEFYLNYATIATFHTFSSSLFSYLPIIRHYILLSIYGCIAVLDLGSFSLSYSIYSRYNSLDGGSAHRKDRYLHTEQHKHRINAHRYPCLEWNSNP